MPGQDWSCQEGGQEKGQEEHCRAQGLELPTVLPYGCSERRMGCKSCSQPRCHCLVFHSSCSILVLPGFPQGAGRVQLENTVHGPCGDCSPHSHDHPRGWDSPCSHDHLWGGWARQTLLCSGFRRSRAISVMMLWGGGSQGNTPSPPCLPHSPARSPRAFLCPPALSPVPITLLHHVVLPQ